MPAPFLLFRARFNRNCSRVWKGAGLRRQKCYGDLWLSPQVPVNVISKIAP